jgi:hypothetical protein
LSLIFLHHELHLFHGAHLLFLHGEAGLTEGPGEEFLEGLPGLIGLSRIPQSKGL